MGYQGKYLPPKGDQSLAQLSRAVMELPSLQGFKSHVDVALGDTVALAGQGEQLDSFSEGFSKPAIPWFHEREDHRDIRLQNPVG